MGVMHFIRARAQYIVGGGLAGLFGVTLVPQTLGLDYYRRLLVQYKDGEEKVLSPELDELVDKMINRINLSTDEEFGLTFFTALGADPVHKGSTRLNSGAIIGIPPTLAYNKEEDIEKEDLKFLNQQNINWESPSGKSLAQSLLLSYKAKAFVLAREINYVRTHHVWVDSLLKTGFIWFAYSTGYFLNEKLDLRNRLKFGSRLGMYGVISAVWFCLYLPVKDAYFCNRDNRIDRKTGRMNLALAEGGHEYYEKVLQRNRAIRTLMGEEGPKYYTLYGNNVHTLRTPQVAFTSRRNTLKRMIEEHHEREAQAKVKDDV